MSAIGYVQKQANGSFKGVLATLLVRTEIEMIPNRKTSDHQPDYRVRAGSVELGGGWIRKGELSGQEYIRLSIAAPDLGPRTIYANLGRAAGQDDDDTYAIIWNPAD